jgi:hypothetical protein
LVCSAACGADLLALEEAGSLGLERHVVLPFDVARFRATSVVDRPGDWGTRFDRVMGDLMTAGAVEVIEQHDDESDAYVTANRRILDLAQARASAAATEAVAIVVWDGGSGGPNNHTANFREEARRRGMRVFEVQTVDS